LLKKKGETKMGAEIFVNTGYGVMPEQAFKDLREAVARDLAYGGYTGTILEKDSFVVIECPPGTDPEKYVQQLINNNDPRINSKWGPAGCIIAKKPGQVKVKEQKVNQPQTTYYVVYAGNMVVGKYKSEKEAIQRAREYSFENLTATEVCKETGKPVCSVTVEYKKDDLGKYVFFGWASC
jgi:hypothetical protein